MRSITRMIVGTMIAIPLTVGAAGMALADDFTSSSTSAGPNGTVTERVITGVDADGNAFFIRQHIMTGPDGASSTTTTSSTGGAVPGAPTGGGSTFVKGSNSAGPNGSSSTLTSSNAGN